MSFIGSRLLQGVLPALLLLGILPSFAGAANNQLVRPQVIGGGEAEMAAYPFVGRLETSVDPLGNGVPPNSPDAQWAGYCTASLIAPQWVVTAAHCALANAFQNRWRVNFLNAADHPIAAVDRAYVHPGYSDWITSQYAPQDIALMHLTAPVSLDKVVVATNRSGDQIHRSNAALAGYGMIDNSNQFMSSVLNTATLKLGSDAYCAAQPGTGTDRVNSSFQLCRVRTAALTGSQGISCNGDSGGPVMIPNQSMSANLLVGIISWGWAKGALCWSPGAYDVYTRVGAVTDWMSRITRQNFTSNPSLNMSARRSSASIRAARPVNNNRLRLRIALKGGKSLVKIWPIRYLSRHYLYPVQRRPVVLRSSNTRGRLFTIPVRSARWRSGQCLSLVVQTVNSLNNYSNRRVYSFHSYTKRHRSYLRAGNCPGKKMFIR